MLTTHAAQADFWCRNGRRLRLTSHMENPLISISAARHGACVQAGTVPLVPLCVRLVVLQNEVNVVADG